MKRIKSFLCIVMLLSLVVNTVICSPIVATADGITTIYSDNIEAQAGENVSIPVKIKNNSGLASFLISFSYDSTLLTPTSVTRGEIIQSGLDDNLEGDAVPGSFKVIWYSSDNLFSNGTMMYLNFKVDDNAFSCNTSIGISYSQEDTFDENFNDVILSCSSINVNISGKNASTWYKSRLVASDQTLRPGETFVIREEKLDVNGSSSMIKSALKYDNDVFEFLGFASSASLEEKNASADGMITLINDNGTCYFEDNPEYEIGFVPDLYLFMARESAINSSSNFDFEVISADYDRIETSGCTVDIANGDNYSIYIDNTLSAREGETLSIPVSILNNKGLMGYMIDFEYNPEQLQPVEVIKGSGFIGTFNDSIGSESGRVQVLWSNTQNNYTNGELFTISFKVLTDKRVMSEIKVNYSQDDTFDESYNDVVLNCEDFSILLNECITHEYELVEDLPATCTEEGYEVYRCKNCGTEYSNTLEALGHDYKPTIIEAATCEKSGKCKYTCSRCSDTYTDIILALGHAPAEAVRENEVAATFEKKGSYDEVVYCSRCEIELSRESFTIPVLQRYITGKCGANVEYTLDLATGLLTISGEGDMYNYSSVNAPFINCPTINEVVIEEGVTSIGEYLLISCRNVESITIPVSVKRIGESALLECYSLTDVYYEGSEEQWHRIFIADLNHSLEDAVFHYALESTPVSIRFEPRYPVKVLLDSFMPYYWIGLFAQGNVLTVINGTDEERFVSQFVDELDDYAFVSESTGEIITAYDDESNRILYGVYDMESGEQKITVHYKDATFEVPAIVEEWDGLSCETLLNGEQTDSINHNPLYDGDITFTYTGDKQVLSWDFGDAIEGYDYRLIAQGENSVTIRYTNTTQRITVNAITQICVHQYEVVVTNPTCTEQGYSTYTCSLCADSYVADYVPALGHSPAEAVRENEVKASCTHTGSYEEVVYCSVCQIELSREQKKADVLEHRFSSKLTAPTCTSKGYTTYTCKDCEYSYISDFTDMIEHHYTAIVHEPTTESQGYTVHVCTECGYAYVDNITEMIPGAIHYIVPSLNETKASLTMKSDEAEYTITSSEGIFALSEVPSNTYRVYAKQKNSLTVCLGEYDTKQGEVVNNENVMLPLGDVNGDDVIDISDISILLAEGNYGNENTQLDLTGDDFISISDVSVALQEQCYGNHSVNII